MKMAHPTDPFVEMCPGDNLLVQQDRDRAPYVRRADNGLIEPTLGNVVNFRAVEDCIRDQCDRFNVVSVGIDPHLARSTLNTLTEDGYPAVEVRQGWVTMAPAIKELERAIIARQFQHGGHDVLRWCFDNIQVETDRAGNRLFSKGKARERIEGTVACAIAVSLAQHGEAEGSIYDLDLLDDEFFI
ncbi:terminase TerL endonuclease subunit [Azospirillum sp. CT11-132]|uniref:terminase TerL endonuclease subunit n=1 Tax=Azospirillum sp. CT11-132 TaxID=3396317 RepID=UPI0039A41C63